MSTPAGPRTARPPAAARRPRPLAPAARAAWGVLAAALLAATLFETVAHGGATVPLAVLGIVGPDLAFLAGAGRPHAPGQLPPRAVGPYNLVHRPWLPLAAMATSALLEQPAAAALFTLGCAWLLHVAVDRVAGFGLRAADGYRRCARHPAPGGLPMTLFTRTIATSVDLDAPPARVWDALADGPAYARWNPFVTRLEGTLSVGSRLDVRIALPGSRPMSFHPTVTAAEPGRRLAWLGRLVLPGVFDGAHSFALEPLPGGGTRLTQSETFRGLLVPAAGGILRRTEAGFAAMHDALRRRLADEPVRWP